MQKQQSGILKVPRGGCKDFFSTNSCRKQLCHPGKKVVMNKLGSVSEVSHSATATTCSECPAQRIPKTQLCPSVPIPPIPAFRVSPLGPVRDTSEPWALSLSGEDTTAELQGGGAPLTDSSPHSPKGPRRHLPNTQTYRQPESISPCLCLWEGKVL